MEWPRFFDISRAFKFAEAARYISPNQRPIGSIALHEAYEEAIRGEVVMAQAAANLHQVEDNRSRATKRKSNGFGGNSKTLKTSEELQFRQVRKWAEDYKRRERALGRKTIVFADEFDTERETVIEIPTLTETLAELENTEVRQSLNIVEPEMADAMA